MTASSGRKSNRLSGLKNWREGFFYDLQLNGPAPDRILHPYADDYSPSSDEARKLIREWIDDKALTEGDITSVARHWLALKPGSAAHQYMHSFVWMRHLIAEGQQGQDAAVILIDAWLSLFSRYEVETWAIDLTAERLVFLFRHAAPLLKVGDALWRSALLSSMARQVRHIAKSAGKAETPRERLLASITLTLAGLVLPHHGYCEEQGSNLLRRELRLQLRQDGGHISRNPSFQMELGLRLLALAKLYTQSGREVPGYLHHAAGRILALVEFYRCGDGKLAVFNGSCEDDMRALTAALTPGKVERSQIDFASHTGYQRLSAVRALVLADLGGPAGGAAMPLHSPQQTKKRATATRRLATHDGALSFQFSSGRHRIVVNCGAMNPVFGTGLLAKDESDEWQHALRQAAAHSTLSLVDVPDESLRHIPLIYHRLFEDQRGQLLEMERTGIECLSGATHRRRLFLNVDGNDLRGEDVFIPDPAHKQQDWVLRFHLHPSIKASLSRDERSIILVTPAKEGWRFVANGERLSLEQSIYTGSGSGRQPTQQIVVWPSVSGITTQIKWVFQRMENGY